MFLEISVRGLIEVLHLYLAAVPKEYHEQPRKLPNSELDILHQNIQCEYWVYIYNDTVTIVLSIIRNSSTPDDGEIVSSYVYG